MSQGSVTKRLESLQTAHRVTRDGRTLLVDQVIETLKIDILKQRYRVGDILPGMIDLANCVPAEGSSTNFASKRTWRQ